MENTDAKQSTCTFTRDAKRSSSATNTKTRRQRESIVRFAPDVIERLDNADAVNEIK